ncbi:hypothetical protein GW17_00011932 [Ensete ventricosum]|nr:hypothetical protein GW17_00011932 [Ensete ventricosum]
MDLKSNHSSPVFTDPVHLSKSRLGLPSNIAPYSTAAQPYSSSGLYLQIPRRKVGKLDDVRASGWLDAMKSSSPPRKKLSKDFISESQSDETDAAYLTWMMQAAVKKAAKCFPTAIISGRSRDKVVLFIMSHSVKVEEVRPVIDWNKGKAVEFLLESLGLSHRDDVLPIYIGDDRTDEDAFKCNRGFGILVSTVPKETNAFYSLRDPSEIRGRRTLPLRSKASARTAILDQPSGLIVIATNTVCFLNAVVVFDLLLDREWSQVLRFL